MLPKMHTHTRAPHNIGIGYERPRSNGTANFIFSESFDKARSFIIHSRGLQSHHMEVYRSRRENEKRGVQTGLVVCGLCGHSLHIDFCKWVFVICFMYLNGTLYHVLFYSGCRTMYMVFSFLIRSEYMREVWTKRNSFASFFVTWNNQEIQTTKASTLFLWILLCTGILGVLYTHLLMQSYERFSYLSI